MDYGNILARAWRITWNYKILWVFGLLAGLGSRNGGSAEFDYSNNGQGSNFGPEIQRQLERPEVIALLIGIVVVILIIAIVLFILSVIGRGGLIGGIRLAEDTNKITFSEAWAIGMRYFWRMLGIQLILFLAGLIVGGVGAFVGLATLVTFGTALCILGPVLCLLVIALIPLSIVAHFAQFGIVLEDLPVMDAFRRAVELIRANIAHVLIMGLIMIVISIIAGLVLVAPFFAIMAPTFAALIADPENPNMGLIGASGLGFLCFLPIAIVLGSILQTWSYSVWTLVYRQFISRSTLTPSFPSEPTPLQPA
jgi:hypothetical protein